MSNVLTREPLTMRRLLQLQTAMGLLDNEPYDWFGVMNHVDPKDTELVEFMKQWREFLDAKRKFNEAVQEQLVKHGFMEID